MNGIIFYGAEVFFKKDRQPIVFMIKFTCESQIDRRSKGCYLYAQHQNNAINLLAIDQE